MKTLPYLLRNNCRYTHAQHQRLSLNPGISGLKQWTTSSWVAVAASAKNSSRLASLGCGLLLLLLVNSSKAATINVPADELTIQAAVNASSDGDTIMVAAGTYDEQVVIDNKSLTLQGAGPTTIIRPSSAATLATTYTYPSGLFPGWVGVNMGTIILVKNVNGAGAGVTIRDLLVDGVNVTNLPAGAARLAGILYGESAGTVSNTTVTTIKTTGYADRSYGVDVSAGGTAVSVAVVNNTITDFARNGVQIQGDTLTASVRNNAITGPGTIGPANVPNGILFIHGAGGTAVSNVISACHHTGTSSKGAGILLFDPLQPGIVIEANEASDVDDGVIVAAGANAAIFRKNNLHNNGVGVQIENGATGNSFINNFIVNNTIAGIRLNGALNGNTPPGSGNAAQGNDLSGNLLAIADFDSSQTFDASGNWYGVNTPAGVAATISGTVDYTPWLNVGTDTDVATPGFQGDFSTLIVDAASPQSGAVGRIQEGVNLVTSGGTVKVAAGSYPELVLVASPMTLLGANAGVDPRATCATGPARGAESIIDGMGTETAIAFQSSGITLDGFTIQGGAPGPDTLNSGLHMGNGFDDNHVLNNIFTGNAIGVSANCAGPLPTEIRTNLFDANNLAGPSGGTGIYVDVSVNLQIDQNEFTGHTDNHPLLVAASAAGSHTGLAVTQNNFHDNVYGVFVLGVNGGTFAHNQFSLLDGTCLAFFGGSSGVDVVSNIFVSLDSSNTRGVRIRDDGYGYGDDTDIEIHGNSFAGFGSIAATAFAVGNLSGYTGTLDASANSWGVNTESGVSGQADGLVDFTPWLDVATDVGVNACDGFQGDYSTLIVSAAGAQVGGTGRIQEGIDLVTLAGTVKIAGGTYIESVNATGNTVTLAPGTSPAQVVINGDVTLGPSDTLAIELNGSTPGTQYDQLVVNGTVTLGGATLSATAVAYADCASLTLIDNDLADAVSGTFAGLPNGAVVTISGQDFKIFYNKGTGNDVLLVKDTTPPLFTFCPPPATVQCGESSGTATATDSCGTNVVDFTDLPTATNCTGQANVVRTWTATDAYGNMATCTQNITYVDGTPPVITCPTNRVLQCGESTSPTNTGTATAVDNCPAPVAITFTDAPTATNCSGLAGIDRTWKATDGCGNIMTCVQQITWAADTTPPVFTNCPTNMDLGCNPTNVPACNLSITNVAATDACSTLVITCTSTDTTNGCAYTRTNTYTATDACGNSNTCSQVITWTVDTMAPLINCPNNIMVNADPGQCSKSNVTFAVTANDVCGGVTVGSNPTNGSTFPVGTTTVNCTATDDCGNTTNCTFTVEVVDNEDPVIVCPTNQIIECTSPSGTPAFFTITATDNCGAPTVFSSPASGDLFPEGTTTVQCAAFDDSFNSAVCNFTVTVVDTTPPDITCPTNMVVGCNRTNGAVVFFSVGVTDICDTNVTLTCTPTNGSLFLLGTTNTVTCTAVDQSGNTNGCSFTITVVEMPPLLTIEFVQVGTNSDAGVVLSWPVSCNAYVLEETTGLNPVIVWTPTPEPVVQIGYQNTVTVLAGNVKKFFRLRYP